MKVFLGNLALALFWLPATGTYSFPSFLLGFAVGYLVLLVSPGLARRGGYLRKVVATLAFALFFLREMMQSALRVAYDVVTPRHHMRPAVLGVPLDARTDAEIALIANLVTLTPGTLSLDVSRDRKVLFIHAMYVDDPDRTRRELKSGLERRVLELLR
jgi:multicomponent Na+:H+ antiporter subunit E